MNGDITIKTEPLHFRVEFDPNDYNVDECLDYLQNHDITTKVYSLGDSKRQYMEINFHVYRPEVHCRRIIFVTFMRCKKGN